MTRNVKHGLPVDTSRLTTCLDELPYRYPGPGGVAGVLRDGEIVAARAWGYADSARAVPMTTGTRLPICSISKQFTCQALLGSIAEPESLDSRVRDYLPNFRDTLPTIKQLCDNQSGLRDYWALTVLQGAHADQTFRREDALPLLRRMRTGHFPAGSAYSYCNANYRIVAEILQAETGASLEALYQHHIWEPAGMATATITSDTRTPADGVVGYEGNEQAGYFPANNGIYWIGDAGISASLIDMLHYEAWIDRNRDDASSLYRRISAPNTFSDGSTAPYGYGLAHQTIGDLAFTGHGGALRGFRSQRLHCRERRLSVMVIFNHEADAHHAAETLARAALGIDEPTRRQTETAGEHVIQPRDGDWLADNGLRVSVHARPDGEADLHYGTGPERLTADVETGRWQNADTVIRPNAAGGSITRWRDNTDASLEPIPPVGTLCPEELSGRYFAAELDASLELEARDGGLYARAEGMLGSGPMYQLKPLGRDVWIMPVRRSMDAPAPGEWTVQVKRSGDGTVSGLVVGCWLARQIGYERA